MTVEYVLLLALFVLFIMGSIIKGPNESFNRAGPRLGARVERHLITGEGFTTGKGNTPVSHGWRTK